MMKPVKKNDQGKKALDLIEEVFSLLRGRGLSALVYYYFGSLPFVLGLLYFFADMSKSAFAPSRLAGESLVLAMLFIWMKAWQSIYGHELLTRLRGETPPQWTLKKFLRLAVKQGIVQPSGLFFLPFALALMLPFGWAYAFYQNMSILDDGSTLDIGGVAGESQKLAKLWQKQNFFLIWALSPFLMVTAAAFFLAIMPIVRILTPDWTMVFLGVYSFLLIIGMMLLSPFGIIVGVNIGATITIIPAILKSLFGVESMFTVTSGSLINTVFFAVVCGLTYLCLDPLMKAAYALRCFYGQSLNTGADLRVELKRHAGKILAAAVIIFSLIIAAPAISSANESSNPQTQTAAGKVTPGELDKALDRELQGREYAWRFPREKNYDVEDGIFPSVMRYIGSVLAGWLETIGQWLGKILRWIHKHMPEFHPPQSTPSDLSTLSSSLMLMMYALVAAIAAIAAVILYRIYKRRAMATPVVASEALAASPDIEDEDTVADELPEDAWLKMARELAEKGQYRLALRAVFLGTLMCLAQFQLIYIARFKSNLDYKKELGRHAHEKLSEMLNIFSESVFIYESTWYGTHDATGELLNYVIANEEKLKASAKL